MDGRRIKLRRLMRKAKTIQKFPDPFAKGQQLLSDGYQEFLGTDDFRDALRFEMLRSAVIQRMWELHLRDDWLCIAKLDEEIATAKKRKKEFCSSVNISAFEKRNGLERGTTKTLLPLGKTAHSHTRFLGSVRQYVPGVGYAVSIKKRHGPNQDSFLLREGMMAVADGTGSEKFSAMASQFVMAKLNEREEKLRMDPKKTIRSINKELIELMSANGMLSSHRNEILGSTTLTLGLLRNEKKIIYSIGDSLPFLRLGYAGDPVVEQISTTMPGWVLGHRYKEQEKPIQKHERVGNPLILTTDGITERIKNANVILGRFFSSIKGSVCIAERIIRLAIRNSLRSGMTDDMTIVIQE